MTPLAYLHELHTPVLRVIAVLRQRFVDAATAGLAARSIVRCAKIATIEKTEVERIGALPAALRPILSHIVAGILAAHQATMIVPD
jgi:hypothetical protein